MKYEYEERVMFGGIQRLYRFENGYGASVIRHDGSYGVDEGFWELAVVRFLEDSEVGVAKKYTLCYNTPITDDVIGYLNDDEVDALLVRINDLKPEKVVQ